MLNRLPSHLLLIRNYEWLLSFVVATGVIIGFSYFLEPRWETNDDVAMSMVAHGYGLAAYGSPNLIFSNPLWGYIVRAIPAVNGVVGYSSATLLCLGLSAWLTLYSLLKLGVSKSISTLFLLLIFARPTLFPQFTINSGLLTVAAMLGLRAYANHQSKSFFLLIGALALAFLGFLIRSQEFILVLAISLPLLPWSSIWKRRSLHIGLLILGLSILLASIVEAHTYTGEGWQYFNQLNIARAPFTDFGASAHLQQRPEIMARYDFSENDLELLTSWFFADPKIADPQTLTDILRELRPIHYQTGSLGQGWLSVTAIANPLILPLSFAAIFLFCLNPKCSTAIAWLLFLGASFTTGVLGRPGILRIYIPLLSLLVAFSLFQFFGAHHNLRRTHQRLHQSAMVVILLMACTWNFMILLPEQASSQTKIQRVQADLSYFPHESVVSWGAEFPFEFAYPVLSNPFTFRNIQLYPLGVFTHAPFSISYQQQQSGNGMIERLRQPNGVLVMSSPEQTEMLRRYCEESFEGNFKIKVEQENRSIKIQRLNCER